jgi:hypothetical protein
MPIKHFLARTAARRDKHRSLRRRGQTAIASRVVISRPASWRRRLLLGSLLVLAAGATGFGLYIAGQSSAGYDSLHSAGRIRDLAAENDRLEARNAKLAVAYNATVTQLDIERGARKTLENQVHKLEDERSQLSRDLALFDNLFPTAKQNNLPAIRSFRIEPVVASATPATWRYRVLVMRDPQAQGSFVGEFRLLVNYRMNGREIPAQTPATGQVSEALQFQHYRRVEGRFQVPPGAVMLGATARVMDNGKLIAESAFRP